MPDYLSLNISIAIPNPLTATIVGWNGSISLDRYGTFHTSPIGITIGKSATLVAGSLTANWLEQSNQPSQQQLNNFLTGNGFNFGVGYWGGGSVSYTPGSGRAWGVGFFTPQIGGSYNFTPPSFDINTPLKW